MELFLSCFIPLFAVVDPIGTLPIYLHLTEGVEMAHRRRVAYQSALTALGVTIGFLFVGQAVFQFLEITMNDFMIAGGILLFVISLTALVSGAQPAREKDAVSLGVVPLGVPVIAGPATLTAIIMLANRFGPVPAVAAAAVNMLLVGLVFRFSDLFRRLFGETGMKAFAKIMNLILAAFAIRMIREGFFGILG